MGVEARALIANVARQRLVWWYLSVVASLTVLSGAVHGLIAPTTGLVRTFYADTGFSGDPLFQDHTTEISLAFLDEDPTLPRRFFSVEWSGFWFLPQATTVELYAGGDDRVDVAVDGQRVLRRNIAVGMHTIGETVTLSAGAHEILVRYGQDGGAVSLNIQYAVDGDPPRALVPTHLFPTHPGRVGFLLAAADYWLSRVVALLWLLPLGGVLIGVVGWTWHRAVRSRAWCRVVNLWRTILGSFARVTGLTASQTLHIFTLTTLAIAQPVFDVVSREPPFFVARNTTVFDLIALVSFICLVLPTVLVQLYEEEDYNERTFDVLPGGLDSEVIILFRTEQVDSRTYRVTPAEPLGLGEFCFFILEAGADVQAGMTIFEFGVDP